MKFTKEASLDDYEILTDSGFQPITRLYETIPMECLTITLDDGSTLTGADKHIVVGPLGQTYLEDLEVGDELYTQDGTARVTSIAKAESQTCYDVEVASKDHLYYTGNILSHNTTSTAQSYILHYALTHPYINIGILANKGRTAEEILTRIKLSYEMLPWFLQVGVSKYNVTSVKFGNGTEIFAAATSNSSIRGKSCVTGDTYIEVIVDGQHYQGSIAGFIAEYGLQPANAKILSQGRFRSFDGFISQGIPEALLQVNIDGNTIKATPEHRFLVNNKWVEAHTLPHTPIEPEEVFDAINVEGTHSYTTNGVESHNCRLLYMDEFAHIDNDVEFYTSTYPVISAGKKTKIIITSTPNGLNMFYKLWQDAEAGKNSYKTLSYDYTVVPAYNEPGWKEATVADIGPRQFAQEYQCSFLGSSNTLISGDKLTKFVIKEPLENKDRHLSVYEQPQADHQYCACVDTAEGTGNDYSAISVIDVTTTPYRQVAVYCNSRIQPAAFARVVYEVAKRYNEAYLMVENNSIGKIVADSLWHDFEYENLYRSQSQAGEQEIGFIGLLPGIRTTKKTKSIGCSTLKSLIESDTLIIEDAGTISELSSFEAKGSSYQAAKGKHDDVTMTLVLFAYLTTQPMFEDLFDVNVRNKLREAQDEFDAQSAFAFFDDGTTIYAAGTEYDEEML